MRRDEISKILGQWFSERTGSIPAAEENYVDAARLDSFDVVELVGFCERRFGFQFSARDLESPTVTTLAGLSEIIAADTGDPRS